MSGLFSSGQGWLLIAAYAVTMISITYVFTRGFQKTKEGFLVANRQVGAWEGGLSIAATWIWAPALFVAAQQAYNNGLLGVAWFTVPNVLTLVIFAYFAHRLRQRVPEGFTLSGYMRERYGNRVHTMYLIELIGLAACSFAVQLLAGGAVVSTLTGIPFFQVTLALAATAVIYSFMSGMRGSVVTDHVQMIIIALVAFTVVPWAIYSAGGWSQLAWGGINAKSLNVFSADGWSIFLTFGLANTIGLLSGPFGDQSFYQRAFALKKNQVVKGFVIGALIFGTVPILMSLLGFLAAGLRIIPESNQLVNLAAVLAVLPVWVAVPFTFMLLSGLVSTLDSNLAAVSSMAGHDILQRFNIKKSLKDADIIYAARLGMVVLTVGAIGIANIPGMQILYLFLFYGALRASTLLPTVISLLSDRVSERGVFWGIVGALVVGLPVFAYGNFNRITSVSVVGSLLIILLSGGLTYYLSRKDRKA